MQVDDVGKNLKRSGIIQIGKRLIKNQNAGGHCQNTGNGQSFFFAAGKPVRTAVPQMLQPDFLQRRHHPAMNLIPAQPQIFRSERHIGIDRFPHNLAVCILKHHSDLFSGV